MVGKRVLHRVSGERVGIIQHGHRGTGMDGRLDACRLSRADGGGNGTF